MVKLQDALAQCLEDLERGIPVEVCLARFPQHARELAPLLDAAAGVHAAPLPVLSTRARVRGRERMHAALSAGSPRPRLRPAWLGGVLGTAFLVFLAAGVWVSSPGRNEGGFTSATAAPAITVSPAKLTPVTAAVTPWVTRPVRITASPGEPSAAVEGIVASPSTVLAPGGSTPSPTSNATPTPMSEAATTEASGLTRTPTPTRDAQPTASATHTLPAPTPASRPQERPKATATPPPTETPEPTPSLRPTEWPEPSRTPRPSETPEPTDEPERSPTPRLSSTAGPTPTGDDDD